MHKNNDLCVIIIENNMCLHMHERINIVHLISWKEICVCIYERIVTMHFICWKINMCLHAWNNSYHSLYFLKIKYVFDA